MSAPKRRLTVEDIARVLTLSSGAVDPLPVYRAVDALVRDTVGYKLLTVFRPVQDAPELERIYSSDMQAYPVTRSEG